MKRRGSSKKSKPQAKAATSTSKPEQPSKRVKLSLKKGPHVASLVQRCLEFIGHNANAVFPCNARQQDGVQKVIRDVLTSWDSTRRSNIASLPSLIEGLFPFLTKLDLSNAHINFSSLSFCKELVSVNLKNTNLNDQELQTLLGSNKYLQDVDLSSCRYISNAGLIKAFCQSSVDLRSLKFNHNTELEGRTLKFVLQQNPNLTCLGLKFCGKLCSADLQHLTELKNLAQLELTGFQHMTSAMGSLLACSKLTSLNLSSTDINDRLLYRLTQGCKGLTTLRLDYAGSLSKKSLMDLAPTLPNLIDLGVAGQLCVDDFVVDQITSYCIFLQHLNVSYTLFSGHFFITKTHDHLTTLLVNGCVNIPTDEQFVQKIKSACPKLVHFQALNLDPLRQEQNEEVENSESEKEEISISSLFI